METWIRSVLLVPAFLVVMLPAVEVAAQSDEDAQTNLVEPQIERVDFDESLIDSADFEIALYGGFLAVEDFDTNFVATAAVSRYRPLRGLSDVSYVRCPLPPCSECIALPERSRHGSE